MTTDETMRAAIEAAARAVTVDRWGEFADGVGEDNLDLYRRVSATALSAALPVVLAPLRELADRADRDVVERSGYLEHPGLIRSDHLRALLDALSGGEQA